jgi:hypothetical protein
MRLMRVNNLRAVHGYRTRRWSVGKPSVLIPNILERQFTVTRPSKAWVTDITYIRTWQGLAQSVGRHGPVLAQDRWVGDRPVHRTGGRARASLDSGNDLGKTHGRSTS